MSSSLLPVQREKSEGLRIAATETKSFQKHFSLLEKHLFKHQPVTVKLSTKNPPFK